MFDEAKPFVSLVAGIAVIIVVCVGTAMAVSGKSGPQDPEAVNARILPVARVELAAGGGAAAGDRSGQQVFDGACKACHETGAAGAPKVGDKGAWAARIGQGLDGLLKSAIKGKNAMPPKGGSDASDVELARAIVFMANKSGASFKEPAAKK